MKKNPGRKYRRHEHYSEIKQNGRKKSSVDNWRRRFKPDEKPNFIEKLGASITEKVKKMRSKRSH